MKEDTENPGYPTINEFKSKKFLNIATAVGIGVSAAAISLDVEAEEKKVVESKETKKDEKKEIKGKIILMVAYLGHKEFQEREKSTKELIALGEKYKKDKNSEMTEFLKAEVQKKAKSNDPEVKERAKKILLAITPKFPVRGGGRRIHRTAGVMIER